MWNFLIDLVYLYMDMFTLKFWLHTDNEKFSLWLKWLVVWSSFVVWIVLFELAFILFFWHAQKLKKIPSTVKKGLVGTTALVSIVGALGIAGMASGMNSLILAGLFALLPLFFVAYVGISTVPMLVILAAAAAAKIRLNQWVLSVLLLGTVTLCLATIGISLTDILDHFPQASRFFRFHGAVKNTCIIDTKHEHCPKTLEEISYIEPQEYVDVMKQNQVLYQYYPETNTYTLLVRYDRRHAVIFDPRLITETETRDFLEVEIEPLGADHIKNPPSLPGLWTTLPEWDKGVGNVY